MTKNAAIDIAIRLARHPVNDLARVEIGQELAPHLEPFENVDTGALRILADALGDVKTPDILRRLAWRELALRFLDSYNPQPNKAIVIADAIVSWDGPISDNTRYDAHHFVTQAYDIIEGPDHGIETESPVRDWIENWLERN